MRVTSRDQVLFCQLECSQNGRVYKWKCLAWVIVRADKQYICVSLPFDVSQLCSHKVYPEV